MVGPTEKHPLIKTWTEGATFHVDVRELLEQGGEPYAYLMECLSHFEKGQAMTVHALFEPRPLVRQVERLGFSAACRRLKAEHWVVEIHAAG